MVLMKPLLSSSKQLNSQGPDDCDTSNQIFRTKCFILIHVDVDEFDRCGYWNDQ